MKRHILLSIILCLVFWIVGGGPLNGGQANAASLVWPISTQKEIYLGAQLDKTIREKYPATQNAALQAYVSRIGEKIAHQSHTNYPFSYTVLADTRTINAFSGPGGFVYITTGLLNLLENEAQLAAVLGHETGHIIKHHALKQMEDQSLAKTALSLLSELTGRNLNNGLTQMGTFILLQKFSRKEEYEADLIGIQLMVNAHYNPQGMVQLLDKLNALDANGVYLAFLQNHPSSMARAERAKAYIEEHHLIHPGQVLDTHAFHEFVRAEP